MKKILYEIMNAILCLFLLTSCSSQRDSDSTRSINPSENDVEWLYLSLDEYADDRLKIEEYEHELITALENISPQRLPLKIAIDEYDVNHDGVEEIIAFHNGDGGAKDAGILMVYFQDQKKESIVSSIRVVGVPDLDILNCQGAGIIKRVEGTVDFIILNRIYVWNGEGWSFG